MLTVIKKLITKNRTVRIVTGKPTILLYHMVANSAPFNSKFHFVSVYAFESLIKKVLLKFTFISVDEFFMRLNAKEDISSFACLTFDDGYAETLAHIGPVLEKLKVPGTFFINSSLALGGTFWRDQVRILIDSGKVGNFLSRYPREGVTPENFYEQSKNPDRYNSLQLHNHLIEFMRHEGLSVDLTGLYCSTEQLKYIESHPWLTIGNHSASHYVMSTLTNQEQEREISICHEFLHQHFSSTKISRIFSMPFGGYHTFNDATLNCLQEAGYLGAVISEPLAYYSNENLVDNRGGFLLYKRFLPKV